MKTAILIQSCDKYEFLWEGLHLSWKLNWNWNKFNFPMYFMTEEKDFLYLYHPMYNIKSKNVGINHFSTRKIEALEYLKKIGYDTVIYSQDDFWIEAIPDSEHLREIFKYLEFENIDCIHMNDYKENYNYILEDCELKIQNVPIKKFANNSPFLYNHQFALWKIDSLLKIQKAGEAPYDNECFGTERAWNLGLNCYFHNYPLYFPEYIHEKGTLKDTAYNKIQYLKFRDKWNS